MRHWTIWTLLLFISCGQQKSGQENNRQISKIEYLRTLIRKIGVQELPYTYDLAISNPNAKYAVDYNSMDTLFFDSGSFGGVLPDTTNFYCIIYYQAGDSLYPFLKTFDKSGNAIDNENIGLGHCRGLLIDIEKCVDQVTINDKLEIDLFYKVTGVAEDTTGQTFKICNKATGTGKILADGQIEIVKGSIGSCD